VLTEPLLNPEDGRHEKQDCETKASHRALQSGDSSSRPVPLLSHHTPKINKAPRQDNHPGAPPLRTLR
jgi:hypothetical protein